MSDDLFLHEAIAIADRYVHDAVHAKDTCTWVNRSLPEMQAQSWRRPVARAAGSKVFDGTAGIGLFLARAYQHSDDAAHRRTAAAAVRHALATATAQFAVEKDNPDFANRFGFYSGAVGVAWVAAELSGVLDDPEFTEQSRLLVARLARTAKKPRSEDLIFGSSGAIPALLDLEAKGVPGALALARSLGDGLLESAVERGDVWSWAPMRGEWKAFLTGFSHGASGFAYGLGTLYAATGEERYRDAALGALAYERRHYIARAANWPDFRYAEPGGAEQRAIVNWCHGAPGIGLARTLLHPILGDDRLLEEARAARVTTQADVDERVDRPGSNWMLCHGVAGNLETLWMIESALGDESALDRARTIARNGVALYGSAARKKWDTPFVDWPTGIVGIQERSLLKGLAGVGHFLLRLHAPEAVPTVLVPGVAGARTARAIPVAVTA